MEGIEVEMFERDEHGTLRSQPGGTVVRENDPDVAEDPWFDVPDHTMLENDDEVVFEVLHRMLHTGEEEGEGEGMKRILALPERKGKVRIFSSHL